MAHSDFVHLRVHTAYSLSEGAIPVKELAKLCREEGMPAVAATDTGNLFGALEFAKACADAGVQPVMGCLLGLRRAEPQSGNGLLPPDRVLLLAQSEAGYRNLIKLVSQSYLGTEGPEAPQVSFDSLAARAEGLIVLIGALDSPVGRLLAEGQREAAESALSEFARAFPGRLYVEIMRHGLDSESRTALSPRGHGAAGADTSAG